MTINTSYSDYNLLLDHYKKNRKNFNLLVRSHYNDKVSRHVAREKQRIKYARNSIKKNIDQFILRSYKREITELKLLQNENKILSWKDNICHHCAACSDPLIHLNISKCQTIVVSFKERLNQNNLLPSINIIVNVPIACTLILDGSAASNILIIGEMRQAFPGIDFDCYSPSYHESK
ncbi:hypothetical protein ACTFIW_007075 [Dictyostelium discoideum]